MVNEHATRLAAAYNAAAASGLRAGLDDLQKSSGGKFKYQIGEIFSNDDCLVISTNIHVAGGDYGNQNILRIIVKSDGQITAYGDDGIEGPHDKISIKGDAKPVIDFVKNNAVRSGLIRLKP